jgi:hypothetical protein
MARSSFNKTIEFIQYHIPALESGTYTLGLTQTTGGAGSDKTGSISDAGGSVADSFSVQKTFAVMGQRFTLNPNKFQSVFPPATHQGDFSNCFPHVVLTSTTLPWQRFLDDSDQTLPQPPWLALLVFYEGEEPPVNQVTLNTFKTANLPVTDPNAILFYSFTQGYGEEDSDPCSVIDLPANLFNQIVPSLDDFSYLAHVKKVSTPGEKDKGSLPYKKYSVVFANRLCPPSGKCTVHLVSFENMGAYLPNADGTASPNLPVETRYVRLVSLKNWSFEVLPHKGNLSDVISRLNTVDGTPYTSPITLQTPQIEGTDDATIALNASFSMGYIPVNHYMRNGDTSVSFYRGPLTPYPVSNNIVSWPNQHSDDLLRYDPTTSMFDVSYAAAWQLGRLLGLQNQKFSENLYKWKRKNTLNTITQLEQKILSGEVEEEDQIKNQPQETLPLEDKLTTLLCQAFENYLKAGKN